MQMTRARLAPLLLCVAACGVGGTSIGPAGPVSSAVVARVPIGDYGTDVAVRPDGARAYVTLRTGRVQAIDTASRAIAATIETEGQPGAIAFTPDGARAYVMDMSSQRLFVLDTRNDRLLATTPVGIIERPIMTPAIAVARDGGRAYVTNATRTDDHLLVVDTATHAIVRDQFLPVHPAGVAVSPDGTRVYVAGCKLACIDGALLTLDAATAKPIATLPLAAAPSGLVLAPDGARAYVANARDASVAIVDLGSGTVRTVAVSPQPVGIALEPEGRFLFVASAGTARIDVVDVRTGTVVAGVTVPTLPRAIAITPDGRWAYVTHATSSCSIIDLMRVPATGTAPGA